jgi:uncharacterized membrane protein
MKKLSQLFVTGLITVLPAAATLWIFIWLARTSERVLGGAIRLIIPGDLYRPGMGIGFGIIVIFLLGLFMRAWIARELFQWAEGLLYRIPFVKAVYGAFRDLASFVSGPGDAENRESQVVLVPLGQTGMEAVGFVTQSDCADMLPESAAEGRIAVYLPMSYQIGGHTVLLPKTSVRPLAISKERAMRFALTAGMTAASPGRGFKGKGDTIT